MLEYKYKEVNLESLQYLSNENKIDVFAFVIMPNHIHLIWRTKELNGKETAPGVFFEIHGAHIQKTIKEGH